MPGAGRLFPHVAAATRYPRLLFASYHCYVDPSSGAAIAAGDLLELLAGRGWDARVFCGPALDFERRESFEQLLSDQRIPFHEQKCSVGPMPFSVFHFQRNDLPATVYRPARQNGPLPSLEEGAPFLALLERVLDQFRPDILLTYGGHWVAGETMHAARRRGICVVFWLRNFAYRERVVVGLDECWRYVGTLGRQALRTLADNRPNLATLARRLAGRPRHHDGL